MPTDPQDRRTPWLLIVILCTAGALVLGTIAGYILRPPSPQDYEARIVGLEADLTVAQENLADAQTRNAELVTLGKRELAALRHNQDLAEHALDALQDDVERIGAEAETRTAAHVQEILELAAVTADIMQQAEELGIPLDADDADEPLSYSWLVNGQSTGALILYPNGRVRSPRGSKSPKYSWRPEASGFHLQFISSRWAFTRAEPGIFTGRYAGPMKSRLADTAELRALAPAAEQAAWLQVAARKRESADAQPAASKPKPAARRKGPDIRVGKEFALPKRREAGWYPAYVDSELHRAAERSMFAGDDEGVAELRLQGRMIFLMPGTRVLVIGTKGLIDERIHVRVRSGPHTGEAWWIPRHLFM